MGFCFIWDIKVHVKTGATVSRLQMVGYHRSFAYWNVVMLE
jgi:hypothetical protein